MRKTLLFTPLAALLIIAMTGCLKDKRYDNNEMGIIIKDIKANIKDFVTANGDPTLDQRKKLEAWSWASYYKNLD